MTLVAVLLSAKKSLSPWHERTPPGVIPADKLKVRLRIDAKANCPTVGPSVRLSTYVMTRRSAGDP